jgi:hypothetical protein
MKTHITYIAIIVSLVLLSVFLFRGGCRPSVMDTDEYKRIAASAKEKETTIRIKTDSIRLLERKYTEDNARTSDIIKSLTSEKEKLSDITGKLKSSVSDITAMYRKARGEADTAVALLLADNQSNICDAYVWQSQRELFVADSIIASQVKHNQYQAAFIQKQIQFRNEFMALSSQKDSINEKRIYMLTKENKRLNNWWNRWGQKAAYGVGAGLIGYGIGQIAK